MRKIRAKKLGKNKEDSDKVLYYQGLPYISKIIRIRSISKLYNDPLAGHFGIQKIQKFVAKKYY